MVGSRAATRPFHKFITGAASFIRQNAVLVAAVLAAAATSVIVPPDGTYLSYFDFKTLTCLFCTLAVICALKNIRFFTTVATCIVKAAGTLRAAVIALVFITYFGSMIIANDMALITFLPLGYIVLSSTGNEKHMAFVFILQNIAANLGGMITPFGNPQNLYLYSFFSIPTPEFISIMLRPFIASAALIILCCFKFKNEQIELVTKQSTSLPVGRTTFYIALFVFSILVVFNVIPYLIGLIVVLVSLIAADRKAIAKVDYSLLLTFVFFFIFAGNMSRIPAVNSLISSRKKYSAVLRSFMPGNQQCSVSGASVKIHDELPGSSCRR